MKTAMYEDFNPPIFRLFSFLSVRQKCHPLDIRLPGLFPDDCLGKRDAIFLKEVRGEASCFGGDGE